MIVLLTSLFMVDLFIACFFLEPLAAPCKTFLMIALFVYLLMVELFVTRFSPAQVMILATLINWSMGVDAALNADKSLELLTQVLDGINGKLKIMAETVLLDLPSEARKKFEQLITELVHQRDVTRSLIEDGVDSPRDFRWLYHLRFHYNPAAHKLAEKLEISLSNDTTHRSVLPNSDTGTTVSIGW
jgi:hypothetical protein